MNHNQSYDVFIGKIRKKIPQNPLLVNMLADILCLEKKTIYRKLRRDVPFTFYEIAVISKKLGISLDNVIGIATEISVSLQLRTPDFINPQDIDYSAFNSYTNFLKVVRECKNTEAAMVTNTIPHELFSGYTHLTQYNLFNWQIHHSQEQQKPFHELSYPERIMNEFHGLFTESRYIPTRFILDKHVFLRLVNTINYFNIIRLIEKEDMLKIKDELLQLLDYMEDMTISGTFKETGCNVYLYISDIDITTDYAYIEADNYKFSLLKTFLLTSATSIDEQFFEKMKNWIYSFIKISTLITATNEKQRVLYFDKQRAIVNEL
jgi:hypothetical protein